MSQRPGTRQADSFKGTQKSLAFPHIQFFISETAANFNTFNPTEKNITSSMLENK